MKFDDVRQGFSHIWDSVADGWHRLREGTVGALTRFRPGEKSGLPARSEVDDGFYWPSQSWSLLGGDLFEDDQRLVVRLEIPGMDKADFNLEVQDDVLVVSGEKRFESESTQGRYRLLQCAYGSFRRVVPLPVPVLADAAKAVYRNGVLRVELPKAERSAPRQIPIAVD
ncbi:MAG: Hsp20/alpha crystallin family protein [Pseudomonadota bacterium]|jgi:HSP20 family protein